MDSTDNSTPAVFSSLAGLGAIRFGIRPVPPTPAPAGAGEEEKN